MVIGVGLAAAAGMGAVGGIVANIALTPLTAGAGLLQSYWYGSGLILGERMMYTVHWEKVKARLDKGENFMDILDQEMNDDITAVATLAFKAMDKTAEIFHNQATISLGKFIEELISAALNPFFSGDRSSEEDTDPASDSDTGLITLTQSDILNMSDTQVAHAVDNQIHIYDSTTQQLLKADYDRRNLSTIQPSEQCPEGQIWDKVSQTCIDINPASTLPSIKLPGLLQHAIGRIITLNSPSDASLTGKWTLETNPFRNGSWQVKQTFTGDHLTSKNTARDIARNNWPSTSHGEYGWKIPNVSEAHYWVRKEDITLKNFP